MPYVLPVQPRFRHRFVPDRRQAMHQSGRQRDGDKLQFVTCAWPAARCMNVLEITLFTASNEMTDDNAQLHAVIEWNECST